MVLGKHLSDSLFKTLVIRKIEEAVYDACSNGLDHIRLNVIDRLNEKTYYVDLSQIYLELILMLNPIHYEFFEKILSDNEKEKWLLVQLDLKNENVKQCYAEHLEKVVTEKIKSTKKKEINLDELSKKDLLLYVEKYYESEEIYKIRKAYNISFKRMRLMVKDYLRNEI